MKLNTEIYCDTDPGRRVPSVERTCEDEKGLRRTATDMRVARRRTAGDSGVRLPARGRGPPGRT